MPYGLGFTGGGQSSTGWGDILGGVLRTAGTFGKWMGRDIKGTPAGRMLGLGGGAAGFGPMGAFGGAPDYEYAPRRRRRGITARDLASFRRVANLIKRYSRPVRSFRTRPGRR